MQAGKQTGRSHPPLKDGALDPGQPFQLLYTSGTTGAPKGALISHRAKLRQGTAHALNLDLRPGDRVLSSLPLSHQFAQWLVLASVPLTGAAVVSRPSFAAEETWRLLAREEITHLPAVPTMLYRMLEAPASSRASTPRLRCIVYGGAPMDPSRIAGLREAFPGVRLFQGFGQTETGYCLGLLDEDHERHPDSLGRPDPHSEIRLLDEAGGEVAPGEVGEIVARTPYLMNGYHKNPEATAAYFAHGPDWGRTGDLAWQDAQGYFHLAGRKDDLVISGGVNIHPAEVERVLSAHPAVAEAAVFGIPDPDWGESLVAAILPGDGKPPAAEQLRRHCRASLADFKCPRRFYILEDFPRTASGKVQKFLLRERVTGGELTAL
jgi:acyl-CoA synthetase (AMP-forming)/AMP-acid ligase II